jgi:hypothetical protein
MVSIFLPKEISANVTLGGYKELEKKIDFETKVIDSAGCAKIEVSSSSRVRCFIYLG